MSYETIHHHTPFLNAGLLIILTIITGISTFTSYWAVSKSNADYHMGLYHWGKSGANAHFQKEPGWWQCVVICQLMAFSFELLFVLLVIPSMIFRRHTPTHAVSSIISLIIFILLTISVITFAVNINSYQRVLLNLKLGWSWGLNIAAAVLSLLLFLVNGSSTGYSAYNAYR